MCALETSVQRYIPCVFSKALSDSDKRCFYACLREFSLHSFHSEQQAHRHVTFLVLSKHESFRKAIGPVD